MSNPKKRGFAALPYEQRRQIASKGGKAKRRKPTGFGVMDPEKHREASRKGGKASKQKKGGRDVAPLES